MPNAEGLQDALAKAREESSNLKEDDYQFSEPAFDRLQDQIELFIRELIQHSIKTSHRHQADTVSPRHVDHAADYLVLGKGRSWVRYLGTFGGTMMGAAASSFLTMAESQELSFFSVTLSAVFLAAGAFLVAIQIARE